MFSEDYIHFIRMGGVPGQGKERSGIFFLLCSRGFKRSYNFCRKLVILLKYTILTEQFIPDWIL